MASSFRQISVGVATFLRLPVSLALVALACSEPDSGGGAGPLAGGSGSGGVQGAGSQGGQATAGAGAEPGTAGSGGAAHGGTSSTAGSAGTAGAGGETADPTCGLGIGDASAPEVLDLSGNSFAHDPTMIEVSGVFHRFWTGPFIPSATSSDLVHWEDGPTVYDGSYSPWFEEWLGGVSNETFNFPWAPDVSAFGGAVHLYSSFSARFGDNISCITHLHTADLAEGEWIDEGPVICTEGSEDYNAIDADLALDRDGTPWLAFGSFWSGIKAIRLDQDGQRADDELQSLASADEIEAPALFYRCGYYYLFVSFGLCCPGENRTVDDLTYRVVVGRSEDILGPYYDRDGTPMLDGGGTLLVEGDGVTFAAAGHGDVIVRGDSVYHLYHAYAQSNGAAELRIAELWFDEDGWPVPHAP